MCLSKCHSTFSQQPVANIYSPQPVSAAPLSSNPCRIPSPGCKVNAGNLTGTCPVCKRNGICIISTTGLLHQHGPRGNKCEGSRSRPFPGSLKPVVPRLTNGNCSQTASTVYIQPSTSSATAAASASVTISNSAATTSIVTSSQDGIISHPAGSSSILKRIPKGARPAVANLLTKLICDVVRHPSNSASWKRLLSFSTACLAKPSRGGRSHNLTTQIVKQVRQYELGEEASPPFVRIARHTQRAKTHDETIASMASAKLEDGDIKGAVRLLCSDDRLAVADQSTFDELHRLHPSAPIDRRPVPFTDMPPLQVSPSAVRTAVQAFPSGSSAGPDGLRPQHLKDLLLGAADDNSLLAAVTDLINLLLAGKVPTTVQGILFGANLLAIAKKNKGIRPIAVGYVWRRLTAKVACSQVKEASATLLAPRQLGFGIAGGAEATVRAARR